MGGSRWLYISQQKAYRVRQPAKGMRQPVPALAGRHVLEVTLYYETRDRKPWKLIRVDFSRLEIDSAGEAAADEQMENYRASNWMEFAVRDVLGDSDPSGPITLPMPPVLPTVSEKETLIAYLKDKMPILWQNSPEKVEASISAQVRSHKKRMAWAKGKHEGPRGCL